ncbi:conserved hypothetical protein [Ureaplasma urealyticum serovar 9 str. ATCC 33175]|nr:conserved hypothetical protein [Ureaplasma urealyticum serovar 9 str. ATCC 33175]
MNNILELKGSIYSKSNPNKPGPRNLPAKQSISLDHIKKIVKDLQTSLDEWESYTDYGVNPIINITYKKIVAKSNRAKKMFSFDENKECDPNYFVIGERYADKNKKHIITYNISKQNLNETIEKIKTVISMLENNFKTIDINFEGISYSFIADINANKYKKIFDNNKISKTTFVSLIVDCYYIENINCNYSDVLLEDNAIITFYKTNKNIVEILQEIGINLNNSKIIKDENFYLRIDELKIVKEKIPYLISMGVKDLNQIDLDQSLDYIDDSIKTTLKIHKPTNEPTIGVIDTIIVDHTQVYFHEWIDYHYENSKELEPILKEENPIHGLEVSSIIVNGPSFNPNLDDGCGFFRVRHFGVMGQNFTTFELIKKIRSIIENNQDIKVWNLSLGTKYEIKDNFISIEASILDDIQAEYDVIFVVSGTNKTSKESKNYKIGSPADSINSLVVNAVNDQQEPAFYTRKGIVLSFFNKPDLAYYGTCYVFESNDKVKKVQGTSYAAAWISRKLGYLINILGFSREVAKALLIHAAADSIKENHDFSFLGYGVVPIKINDIVYAKDNEIKFFINGSISEYETYTHTIPIPTETNKHPYLAKATLSYFPQCSRNQGVDYTNVELDLHFGRIDEDKKSIISINNNLQDEDKMLNLFEGDARNYFRKWDNIKYISDYSLKNVKPRKAYGDGFWGFSLKAKTRSNYNVYDKKLKFGLVFSFFEINNKNRIHEFIKSCLFNGWLVKSISVDEKINLYNKLQEKIDIK